MATAHNKAEKGQIAKTVLMCGDPYQTIYSWRGSSPFEIIRDFKNNFNALTISLNGNQDETVSYFDFNDGFVVTAYQDSCNLYKIDENFKKINVGSILIADGTNVAINNLNQLFIIANGGIYKTTFRNRSWKMW